MTDRGKENLSGSSQTASHVPNTAAPTKKNVKPTNKDPKDSWKQAKKAHFDRGDWLVFSYDNGKNGLYFGPNENHSGKVSAEPYPELHYSVFAKNVAFVKDSGFLKGYKMKTRFYSGENGEAYNNGSLCVATFICACATKVEARERQDRINNGENPFRSHVERGNYSGVPGALFLPSTMPTSASVPELPAKDQVATQSFAESSSNMAATAVHVSKGTSNQPASSDPPPEPHAQDDTEVLPKSAENAIVIPLKLKWVVVFPSDEPEFKDLPTVGYPVLELEKEKLITVLKVPYCIVKTHGKSASFMELQDIDIGTHVLLLPPNPAGLVPFGDKEIIEIGETSEEPAEMPSVHEKSNGVTNISTSTPKNREREGSPQNNNGSEEVGEHRNGGTNLDSNFLDQSDNEHDPFNGDKENRAADGRPVTPAKLSPKKRASSEPSPRKVMDPRRSNPKMKKQPGVLEDPFAYLKHKEKAERYSDLKNPDDVAEESCKLFDKESPWHFQIENRDPEAYRRLVKDFKVFIDKEGQIALSKALQPGAGQKPLPDRRYLYNLVRRLIGGTEGMRRAISIYHIRREEALKKRKKVTRFAEALFGEEFLDALKAHCKRMAKLLNRPFAKPNNFDTLVTALIRSDGNHLFERYCSNNRIDWASIQNHPMKRRTNVRQRKHRNVSDSDSDDLTESEE